MGDDTAYDWLSRLSSIGMTAEEVGKARIMLMNKSASERKAYLADPPADAAATVRALLEQAKPSAASGYTRRVARMMEALRSMRTVPGPGEVLSLGPDACFQFHPIYNSLFVRECYPRLFDALVRRSSPNKYIVTGTAGIGKSWFFYYLLARLLKLPLPPPFIVWEHMTSRGMAWCYTLETREVRFAKSTAFLEVLDNPATWYISDGISPQLNSRARIVLLTSPKRETYKEMEKALAQMLCMPSWTRDELRACRSLLYGTVDGDLVEMMYKHYGGVARYVLQLPSEQPDVGLDELLLDLRKAIAACNTEKMRTSIGSIDTGPEATHRLLHIVADENFHVQQLMFASKWVVEEFAKKAAEDELQGLISLLSSTSGALLGMLYEPTMHAILPKGGPFIVAPVIMDETLGRGIEETLVLDSCTETQFFEDLSDVAKEHVYYRPSSTNFPAVDAIRLGKDTWDFFQMTVGSCKKLDAARLSSVLTQMQLPKGVTPRLHFVVQKDAYRKFKLTAGENWPPSLRQAASRMKVYIMKGAQARLKVCI